MRKQLQLVRHYRIVAHTLAVTRRHVSLVHHQPLEQMVCRSSPNHLVQPLPSCNDHFCSLTHQIRQHGPLRPVATPHYYTALLAARGSGVPSRAPLSRQSGARSAHPWLASDEPSLLPSRSPLPRSLDCSLTLKPLGKLLPPLPLLSDSLSRLDSQLSLPFRPPKGPPNPVGQNHPCYHYDQMSHRCPGCQYPGPGYRPMMTQGLDESYMGGDHSVVHVPSSPKMYPHATILKYPQGPMPPPRPAVLLYGASTFYRVISSTIHR